MNRDIDFYSGIIDTISDINEMEDVKNIFWKTFLNKNYKHKNEKTKVLLLNSPCFGFGDVVFCIKLSNYLKEWYNANVTIATTDPNSFKKLGAQNIVSLLSKNKDSQCRRFKYLYFSKNISKQDLIFVAPLQSDYNPSLNDVRFLVPYATKFNTFFFSEYNHYDDSEFDFSTGLGKNKFGLLFTNTKRIPRLKKLKNPYALIYIAESIDDSDYCFFKFIEMVSAKYNKKYKNFDIVIPDSLEYFFEDFEDIIVSKIKKYYPNIRYVGKTKSFYLNQNSNRNETLTFRSDVLPLSYREMSGLIENSVKDILLTGDQSITDALSCCSDKNIFYQIAPWKEDFGKNLAKLLPNKYLSSVKTSCGTLKAIKYNSNYKNFVKEWDFRRLAKPKLDSIFSYINFKNKNKKDIEELENIILRSKSVDAIKEKIKNYFRN